MSYGDAIEDSKVVEPRKGRKAWGKEVEKLWEEAKAKGLVEHRRKKPLGEYVPYSQEGVRLQYKRVVKARIETARREAESKGANDEEAVEQIQAYEANSRSNEDNKDTPSSPATTVAVHSGGGPAEVVRNSSTPTMTSESVNGEPSHNRGKDLRIEVQVMGPDGKKQTKLMPEWQSDLIGENQQRKRRCTNRKRDCREAATMESIHSNRHRAARMKSNNSDSDSSSTMAPASCVIQDFRGNNLGYLNRSDWTTINNPDGCCGFCSNTEVGAL